MKKILTIAGLVSVLGFATALALAVSPTLSLNPTSGTLGTVSAISIAHFNGNAAVHFTITGHTGNIETSTITTNNGGNNTSGTITIIIPLDVVSGVNTITASDGTNSATAMFTVIAATTSQTITFDALPAKVYGDPDFTVSATATSGLTPIFTSSSTPICTVSGSTVHIVTAGSCTIVAYQAGNGTYAAATPVPQTFTVNKATTSIAITNTSYLNDNTAKSVTVTTTPTVSYTVTYDGFASAPSTIGTHAVTVTANDPNYTGTATATLTIANNLPVIMLLGDSTTFWSVNYNNVVDAGATATDFEDGKLSVTQDTPMTADNVGTYTITYAATDSLGATSTVTRTVIVVPQSGGAGGPNGVPGCMDLKALNYDVGAIYSGFCSYPPKPKGEVLGTSTSTLPTGTSTTTSSFVTSTSQGQVLGASKYAFGRNLGFGARGTDVEELQKLLITAGNLRLASTTQCFGSLTKAAVLTWQAKNKLPATGYFGTLSRAFTAQ